MESLNISNHIDLESGQGSDCVCRSSGEKGGNSSLSDDSDGHTSSEELDHSGPEIVGVAEKGRESSNSECSVDLDLEAGEEKEKSHLVKSDRDCRICHLALDDSNQESGFPIELGCSCKNDLAAAHKQCAEAWFKIKGNRTCEICGLVARNVSAPNETQLSEQWMKKMLLLSLLAFQPPLERHDTVGKVIDSSTSCWLAWFLRLLYPGYFTSMYLHEVNGTTARANRLLQASIEEFISMSYSLLLSLI